MTVTMEEHLIGAEWVTVTDPTGSMASFFFAKGVTQASRRPGPLREFDA